MRGIKARPHPKNSNYIVHMNGSVYSCYAGRFLKFSGAIYGRTMIKIGNRLVNKLLSHLVLETFVGPRPENYHAAHLDGNPKNNSLHNLRWVTAKENVSHQVLHGTACRGVRHGCSKLTEAQVEAIRREYVKPKRPTYPSNAQIIAQKYGVHRNTVTRIASGRGWASTVRARTALGEGS